LMADVDQDGWRIPLTGHFRSRTHWTDILWFDPRDATLDTWSFNYDFSAIKSGPGSVELLGVAEGTEYLPIVGNFDGDNRTDLFWHTPGTAPDWLWLSLGDQDFINFQSYELAVDGEYHPVTGDFDGDDDDDILWYRPAVETAGGNSWIWYFDGASIDAHPVLIQGDYVPYVEDFDSDGCRTSSGTIPSHPTITARYGVASPAKRPSRAASIFPHPRRRIRSASPREVTDATRDDALGRPADRGLQCEASQRRRGRLARW
jgi:hypothetical protein